MYNGNGEMPGSSKSEGGWQEEAKTLIKEFEGLSLKPYKCPAGYNTIGYGHVMREVEESLLKDGIGESTAEILMRGDINVANQALNRLVRVPLNEYQRAALVSFIFNIGAGAFQASTLRQKLNRGEYSAAAEQFTRWIHGGGRPLPGLLRRRHAERALFLKEEAIRQPQVLENTHVVPSQTFWKQAAAYLIRGLKMGVKS